MTKKQKLIKELKQIREKSYYNYDTLINPITGQPTGSSYPFKPAPFENITILKQ